MRVEECPADLVGLMEEKRAAMLDEVSAFDDEVMEKYLEGEELTEEEIHKCVRNGVNSLELTPVYMGSAFKNKGVQPLLNAVARYLPSPLSAAKPSGLKKTKEGEVKITLEPDFEKPLVCMAFKITDEQFGQLTYTRIYQGTLNKGETIWNTRTGKKVRIGRMVRMNSNDRDNIDSASAGDIIAMVGIDCASGDTFVGRDDMLNISCEGMHIPIPVIELSIKAKDKDQQAKMAKGLNRFRKEDPTFHVFTDEESGETRIAGMGELHLEIYVERLKREYKADVEVGAPQVNYRETIRMEAPFDYTHKKQTGGSGQFGQVVGAFRPLPADK
ncbi:MAG: EF-Tu/IF-2/RF-3 family GTPase [Bacteriovoracaceae bacterium]